MNLQSLRKLAALVVSLGAFNIAHHAQSQPPNKSEVEVSSSDGRWTVLTMASDGSWGAATESMSNRAIANAIAECKFMSRIEIGCGAYMISIQQGWVLGIRCGNENIIVAARDLADAESAAIRREVELRNDYVPDMPACRRVVTINSNGAVIVPSQRNISSKY